MSDEQSTTLTPDSVVERLRTDAAARTGLAEIVVDYALGLPLRELLDPADITEVAVAAMTDANAERVVERHVAPGWDRERSRARTHDKPVGHFLADSTKEEIIRLVVETKPPVASWSKDAIDPQLVRQLFAPVLQEILLAFAKRLPIPGTSGTSSDDGGGGRGRLRGVAGRISQSVGRRAEKLVDASKSVLGGLGAEMERQFQSVAKDFSQTAMQDVRDAIRRRLRSAEGRELLDKMARQLLERVFETPVRQFYDDIEHVPHDEIMALSPATVAHLAQLPEIRDLIESEVAAFFDSVGGQTLGQLLEEADLHDRVRTAVVRRVDQLAEGFLASEAFGAWMRDVLA